MVNISVGGGNTMSKKVVNGRIVGSVVGINKRRVAAGMKPILKVLKNGKLQTSKAKRVTAAGGC